MFSSRRSRNRHSANPNPKLHSSKPRRKLNPHDGRSSMPANVNMASMLGLQQPGLYANIAAALVANQTNNQNTSSSSSSSSTSSHGKNGLKHNNASTNGGRLNSSLTNDHQPHLTSEFLNSTANALLSTAVNDKSDSSDLANNFNLLNQLSSQMDQASLLQVLSKFNNNNSTSSNFAQHNSNTSQQSNHHHHHNNQNSNNSKGDQNADQNEFLKNFGSLLIPGAGFNVENFKQQLQKKKSPSNNFLFNSNFQTHQSAKIKPTNQSKLGSKLGNKLNSLNYSSYSTDDNNSCSGFEEDDLNDEKDDDLDDDDENDDDNLQSIFKNAQQYKQQQQQPNNKHFNSSSKEKLNQLLDEPINRSQCASPMDDCQQSIDHEMMSVGSSRSSTPLTNNTYNNKNEMTIDDDDELDQQLNEQQDLINQGIDLRQAKQFLLNEALKRNRKSFKATKQTDDEPNDRKASNEDDELKENHLNATVDQSSANLYKYSDLSSLQAPKFNLNKNEDEAAKSKPRSTNETPNDHQTEPSRASPVISPKHLTSSSPLNSSNHSTHHQMFNNNNRSSINDKLTQADRQEEAKLKSSPTKQLFSQQLIPGQLNSLLSGFANLSSLSELGVDLEQLKSNPLAAAIAALNANTTVTQSLLNSAKNSSLNNSNLNGKLSDYPNADLNQLQQLQQLNQLNQRNSTSSPFDDSLTGKINLNHSISSTSSGASMSNVSTISSPNGKSGGKMMDNKLVCRDANEVGPIEIPYDKNNPKMCVMCNKQFQNSVS